MAALAALAVALTPSISSATPRPAPSASTAVHPRPHDDGPHPPLISRTQAGPVQPHAVQHTVTTRALTGGGAAIDGLDLHDGTLLHLPDGRYAFYGTMYGCGYQWYVTGTPWCGFGVSTAPSLTGPWSPPTTLFSPSDQDPWSGLTWSAECGSTGQGCFNPRMIQRSGWGANDGVWILWFNSPIDYSRNKANAYNMMGCAGPTGPCGPGVTPYGSYHKPSLAVCSGNGDFGMITSGTSGQAPAIVCTMPGAAALNIEEIDKWGANGDGTGVRSVAGLSSIEGPGGWWDLGTSQYVLTYSDPSCGYCSGTSTGYATAPSLYSGWTAPANLGFGQPLNGRRLIAATSCGGQPRTVSVVDGVPYQVLDTWTGSRNETGANTIVAPLTVTAPGGVAADGHPWTPPVTYPCT